MARPSAPASWDERLKRIGEKARVREQREALRRQLDASIDKRLKGAPDPLAVPFPNWPSLDEQRRQQASKSTEAWAVLSLYASARKLRREVLLKADEAARLAKAADFTPDPTDAERRKFKRLLASAWGAVDWREDVSTGVYQKAPGIMFDMWLLSRLAVGNSVHRVMLDLREDVAKWEKKHGPIDHPLVRIPMSYAVQRTTCHAHKIVVSLCAGTIRLPRYERWALRKSYRIKEEKVRHEQRQLIRASYGEADYWADGGPARGSGDPSSIPREPGARGYGAYGWYPVLRRVNHGQSYWRPKPVEDVARALLYFVQHGWRIKNSGRPISLGGNGRACWEDRFGGGPAQHGDGRGQEVVRHAAAPVGGHVELSPGGA